MKIISIPEHNNPFTVIINNSVYQYRGGETIEVPDEVAEAIEDALELVPKPKRYLSKLAQRANGTLLEITANDLEGVETIIDSAFRSCASVTSIEFPDSVKSIQQNAFLSCGNVKSIRFGDNSKLESIGVGAFNWCSNLAIVYLPPNPPVLENVSAFNNIKADCVFYCKTQASLDAYKSAENWSTLSGTYSFVVEE
jgi:tRNA threonylcarbamoyladenosine modification (KEOPS) complex  Pcc1 subunit